MILLRYDIVTLCYRYVMLSLRYIYQAKCKNIGEASPRTNYKYSTCLMYIRYLTKRYSFEPIVGCEQAPSGAGKKFGERSVNSRAKRVGIHVLLHHQTALDSSHSP